jgi:predicted phage tail protein
MTKKRKNDITVIQGYGSGKGGGGARAATEEPDSLKSKQYARIIDLISEGEIEGFVKSDPLECIYLDDVPVKDSAGNINFPGFSVVAREGTQFQSYIQGFSSVESTSAVAKEIKKDIPIVESLNNPNFDAAIVTVSIPRLFFQDPQKGDIKATEVELKVELNSNGAGYQEVLGLNNIIKGKTSSNYKRSFRVNLSDSSPPWLIRVSRITDDAPDESFQNKTFFESITGIIESKLTYPNSAIVAMSVDSEQFSSIPARGFHIKGLRIKIPVNYDPIARTYSGTWNGTFKTAWSNNPAWVLYDILTESRYGLGRNISEDMVDKWALYSIGKYCDELVDSGFFNNGVMIKEPRFTCNTYIQSREEAYKVINVLTSVFRAMNYWANGTIITVQDKPEDPVALFTNANVIDGTFTYSGSSGNVRHNVALVTWNDPDDMYRQKIEYVEDSEAVKKYGIIETEVLAMGCTSRGQAHRFGKWILISEQVEKDTVIFRVGMDSAFVFPGAVIRTNDTFRSGRKFGGRIVETGVNSVKIDSPINILSTGWEFAYFTPEGEVKTAIISNAVGNGQDVITFSTPLAVAPLPYSIWVITESDITAYTWRVISIVEMKPGEVEISAIAHRPDKYAAVEEGLILEPLQTSAIDLNPPIVEDVSHIESPYYAANNVVGISALISWESLATSFQIQIDGNNINPIVLRTGYLSITVNDLEIGTYTVRITPFNIIGRRGQTVTYSMTIQGYNRPPPDVTGFRMTAILDNAYLQWDPTIDPSVLVGGNAIIKYTPDAVLPSWNNSVLIGESIPGNTTNATVPLLNGSYLIKWINFAGFKSLNPAIITTNIPNLLQFNVVKTLIEDPDFVGQKENVVVENGELKLANNELSGIYYFSDSLILPSVKSVRAISNVVINSYSLNYFVDEWGMIDTLESIDGETSEDTFGLVEVRSTEDDPTDPNAEWSEWQVFQIGDYKTRSLQFRVKLERDNLDEQIGITRMRVEIDVADRIYSDEDILYNVQGPQQITFPEPFVETPAISVTAQEMQLNDYFEITEKNNQGFKILFKNLQGDFIVRTYDWLAKGF